MRIEKAGAADAGEILRLQKLAYQSEARIYDDFTIPPLIQTADEIEADFLTHVFLKALTDAGDITGSVRACLDQGTCRIGRLIVHPDAQNRGIGTRLLEVIERRFANAERFELFTGHKSGRNLHLYQKLGYSVFRSEKISETLTLVYLEKLNEYEHSRQFQGIVEVEIERLRKASEDKLRSYDRERSEKRLRWFRSHRPDKMFPGDDYLLKAYHVLLERLQSNEAECPVVYHDTGKLVFHSANFCPTLEACRILQLDTRHVCRLYSEPSTDRLVREIHPKLKFTRNYEKLRPYWGYCEEIIELEE
jgi:ribosomal protein S18 acetylase RimI-like enzyme